MDRIKKFFGGVLGGLWENKGAIAGAVGGMFLANMLFPEGGLITTIIGVVLGALALGMLMDDGDGIVNTMLNRKQDQRGNGHGLGRDRAPYVYKHEDRIQYRHKELGNENAILSGVQSNDNKTFTVENITVSSGAKVNFSDPVTLKLDENGKLDTTDKGVQDFAQRLEKLSLTVRQASSSNSQGANSFTSQEVGKMQSAASNLGGVLNQSELATYNRYANNGEVDTKAMFADRDIVLGKDGKPKVSPVGGFHDGETLSSPVTPPKDLASNKPFGGRGHPAGK